MIIKSSNRLARILKKMDLLMHSSDILNLTEIIRHRLYFAVVTPQVQLRNTNGTMFFNVDEEYIYLNYYYDFGPLNISCLYKYCCKVNEYLQNGEYKRIVHCTSSDPATKANAAFLIGSFAVIYLKVHPREMTKALVSGCFHFMPFNDASQGGSEWKISLADCFCAVFKAFHFGFVNFNDFDVDEYDIYDKLQNGDMNWLLPKKFLAFIGPTDLDLVNYHSPDFYIQYFIHNDIKAVVRLNNNTYNSSVFKAVGIGHYDLFFPDGTTPPKHILLQFLNLAESIRGPIAVHCKAGLGRTGSLIGAYIVKHYRFTAREAIAWLRICRPGSVIGQQQGWLEHMESWLLKQGNYFRFHNYGDCDKIPRNKYGMYSLQWKNERNKAIKLAKERELQAIAAAAEINKYKMLCKSAPDHIENKAESSKHRANKVLKEKNNSFRTQVIDRSKYKFGNLESPSCSKTQGDKLNIIKMQKQSTLSQASTSTYMPEKQSSATLRSKQCGGATMKKTESLRKKK